MTRQQIRKMLMLVSFLLFPITIFSPVWIIFAAIKGIIAGSFVMFIALLLTSLFFGRAFCGWLCSAGGLQEICTSANDKPAVGGKYNNIK